MTPEYIFVHHTAVSYEKNPDQWQATDNYHRGKGWGGGGYNYEISKVGGVHQFREDGSPTAAQYQQNMNDGRAISICLDGNFDIEVPTDEQCRALYELITEKMNEFDIPRQNVFPHRHVAKYKSCWGRLVPTDIMSYLEGRLQINAVPDWAEETVQVFTDEKIATEWGRPHEDLTNEELGYIMYRLGLSKRLHKHVSKLEFCHMMFKAGFKERKQ